MDVKGYAFGDCAFNPADATLYMVDGRSARGLYRINLTTGAATLVGIHGLNDVFALGYHPPTNHLYAIDGNGDLFTLSTATGAATRVGPTFLLSAEGLAFDATRNAFHRAHRGLRRVLLGRRRDRPGDLPRAKLVHQRSGHDL
jgi:hypothetical protein